MAGTKYLVKEDLLNSIASKVFTNNNFATTSANIQLNDLDIVESLWDRAGGGTIVDTTHNDLVTLIGSAGLEVGNWYRFDYEHRHVVPGTTVVNTEIPGYNSVTYTETIMVLALTTNTLHTHALSVTNPNDLLRYNYFPQTIGASLITTQGAVTWRKDTDRNIETPFDFRNYWVERGSVDFSGIAWDGDANQFELVSGAAGSSDSQVRLCHTTTTTNSSGFFTDVLIDEGRLNQATPVGTIIQLHGNNLPAATGGTYKLAINSLSQCKNIFIAENLSATDYDIYIDQCRDVYLESDVNDATIFFTHGVRVGKNSNRILLFYGKDIQIRSESNDIILNECFSVRIGMRNEDITMYSVHEGNVGWGNTRLTASASYRDNYGDLNTDVVTWRSFDSFIKNSCSNILMGAGTKNRVFDSCTNVTAMGGNSNTFYEECNTITVFNVSTGGGVIYATYSPMDRCTFHKGCNNLSFYQPTPGVGNPYYVRDAEFGQGCANLVFGGIVDHVSFAPYTLNKTINIALYYTQFVGSSFQATTINAVGDVKTVELNGATANDGGGTNVGLNDILQNPVDQGSASSVHQRTIMWHPYLGNAMLIPFSF